MKRKWTSAPRWVDWLAQVLYGLDHNWPKPPFSEWATTLLDRYCQCELCLKRAAEGHPYPGWRRR